MKTRKYDWYNEDTMRAVYSYQYFKDGKWVNVAFGAVPQLFDTAAERDSARVEFKRLMKEAGAKP